MYLYKDSVRKHDVESRKFTSRGYYENQKTEESLTLATMATVKTWLPNCNPTRRVFNWIYALNLHERRYSTY